MGFWQVERRCSSWTWSSTARLRHVTKRAQFILLITGNCFGRTWSLRLSSNVQANTCMQRNRWPSLQFDELAVTVYEHTYASLRKEATFPTIWHCIDVIRWALPDRPSLCDHLSPRTNFHWSLWSKWNVFSFLTCWREQKKLLNSSIIYPNLHSMVSSCVLDSTGLTIRLGPYIISTCSWNRRSSRTHYCLQRNCVFATLPTISICQWESS